MLSRQFTARIATVRGFHAASALRVKAGDKIPSVQLQEGAPSNNVNIAEITANGKHIIVGVPGAYSPACSASHVPGYIGKAKEFKSKGIQSISVIAVNDAFVTGAWANEIGADENSGVRVFSDAHGSLSKKLDTLFDASKFFGNERSKRFAAIVEDGKVVKAFVEPDNVGVTISSAEEVLKQA